MTEDQILTAVMDEMLFGALEVYLHVLVDLKSSLLRCPRSLKTSKYPETISEIT
jgi:hypothetical protein